MNLPTPIYLVSEKFERDENGVMVATMTKRKVYANIDSVTGRDWFEGGRNGLNPQYRMTMFAFDYEGEEVLEYNGQTYAIYRTYLTKHSQIELYVEKRKGRDGISAS